MLIITHSKCIIVRNYLHFHIFCTIYSEAILSSLAGDPSRTDSFMAEVKEQSADNLVDGVSAEQEEKYDYAHYFGGGNNRFDKKA